MSNINPLSKSKKISLSDIERLPERIEIINGDLDWTDDEKQAVISSVLTNVGLDYLVSILSKESIRELKRCLDDIQPNSEKEKGTRKKFEVTPRVQIPMPTVSPATREIQKRNKEVIQFLKNHKNRCCFWCGSWK
ncbi:hypothetical protein ACFQPF_03635 [Fictibacillus iocasae]|uniref:Uncharacterized protein n=1 Tax=Fictibacillus iocasae TaxID=2715437 RepID=A0ABW2NK19_9BACL